MRHRDPAIMDKIVKFVDAYYLENGRSPSTSEIGNEIGVSKSTACRYLQEMRKKKMIVYDGRFIETNLTSKATVGNKVNTYVLDSISCGTPLLEEENINEYVSLPESIFGQGEFMLLMANGDSMIDAGIDDGDMVVIRKQSTAEDGQIVAALIEGMNTLKTLYRDEEKHKVILHPENKALSDIIVDNCMIQGVAINVIKSLKR